MTNIKLLEKLKIYKAPNDAANTTVNQVLAFQVALFNSGMGFDSIVAIEGSDPNNPASELDLAVFQMMKVPADEAFNFFGRYKGNADQKGHNIGLEQAEIAGMDGTSKFIHLHNERHPGESIAAAVAAMAEIPSLHTVLNVAMDSIWANVNIEAPPVQGNIQDQ